MERPKRATGLLLAAILGIGGAAVAAAVGGDPAPDSVALQRGSSAGDPTASPDVKGARDGATAAPTPTAEPTDDDFATDGPDGFATDGPDDGATAPPTATPDDDDDRRADNSGPGNASEDNSGPGNAHDREDNRGPGNRDNRDDDEDDE
jgi:hypothetical protein